MVAESAQENEDAHATQARKMMFVDVDEPEVQLESRERWLGTGLQIDRRMVQVIKRY